MKTRTHVGITVSLRFAVTLCGLLSIFAGQAMALETACGLTTRDGSGYLCAPATSDSIPDIALSGTALSWNACLGDPGDDCESAPQALTAPFEFYGAQRSSVVVSSNGYVSFTGNAQIPVPSILNPDLDAPNATIFAYGDDLDASLQGNVYVANQDCTGAHDSNACFVVQWDQVAIKGVAGSSVTVQLALDLDRQEFLVEIEDEIDPAGDRPQIVGTEADDGITGLWYRGSGDDSRDVGTADRFVFAQTIQPASPTLLTTASGPGRVTLEWSMPEVERVAGTIVFAKEGSAVGFVPEYGQEFTVGEQIEGNRVVCVNGPGESTCRDEFTIDGGETFYRLFAFDEYRTYSAPLAEMGSSHHTTEHKWTRSTIAGTMPQIDVVAGSHVVALGSDRRLHRMREIDGKRTDWTLPVVPGTSGPGPEVEDLSAIGPIGGDPTAFIATDDGWLYRYAIDGDGSAEASANVLADSGCSSGALSAKPVVMNNALDDNHNELDAVIAIMTDCDVEPNKFMLYTHDLQFVDAYDGDDLSTGGTGPGLGRSTAQPALFYRTGMNDNLLYVPLHHDGDDNESLLVIRSDWSTGEWVTPIYSEVKGLGDITATPVVFNFANSNNYFVLLGNSGGTIHMRDAQSRSGPDAPAPLKSRGSFTPPVADGPIKGLDVSLQVDAQTFDHWIVYTTDTLVQGLRVKNGANLDPSSHWSLPIDDPSLPLIVDDLYTPGKRTYVGSSDGYLYAIDAMTGTILEVWQLDFGHEIGTPVLDEDPYGVTGLAVPSSSGRVYWTPIPKWTESCTADVDADGALDCDDTCFDMDGDGYGDVGAAGDTCLGRDCDDTLASCGADCTGDSDADGTADCLDGCVDVDADGFGTGANCLALDCDDAEPTVYPGAEEICDGLNNDCDDANWPDLASVEADLDLDGFQACAGDCDDSQPTVYPGAPQICDGLNNNCSTTYWPELPAEELDYDGDGLTECTGDCDDTLATCGSDCLTDVDDDATADCADLCLDADGDGYGARGGGGKSCIRWDCDDEDAAVPSCANRECGDDGCGFSCGSCPGENDVCNAGVCECVPDCTGKVCGDDGCGGTCGTCLSGDCDVTTFTCCASDADGDGACDANDCDPSDPGSFVVPAEVAGLTGTSDGTLTWVSMAATNGSGTVYDVARGDLSELPVGTSGAESCVSTGLTDASFQDLDVPAPGAGFYYLVRAVNACGVGTYGHESDTPAAPGQERLPLGCP